MAEGKKIEIQAAKGRPILHWVGKQPLRHVTAFPAQHIEVYGETPTTEWRNWPKNYPQGGLLFHGDNKEVLAHLLSNGFRGEVDLIYIDPPFDSGADYVRKVGLRGVSTSSKLSSEQYTIQEQIQYTDIWANDLYLQFMFERLQLLKELLSSSGSIFLHCDWHKGHHLRLLMDEVFGAEMIRNEIIWRYSKYQMRATSRFVNNHDTLLWYANGDDTTYNLITEELEEPKLLKRKRWDKKTSKIVNVRDDDGNLIYDEYNEEKVDDVWNIDIIGATSGERTDYPTQKPISLLRRILSAASNPNDLVLDSFAGSGTTLVAAQELGRRWIGCDINKGAIQTTSKRLTEIIESQQNSQQALIYDENNPAPAQLAFSVYRVNDYDLQIQHNEAVELAAQHIGVQRSKADAFFDGTHGKKLAKIIPFNHPLTLLDLEEIKRELDARPEEDRNITVVCLGKETAVDAWVEDWNKLRKKGDVPNKIDVIELRSDPKYGKFFIHAPATAKVSIKRAGEKIDVEIRDFISPSIIERLKEQAGLLSPKIDDWRAMVDTVMIDPAYDGEVFNVALADVPEKKNDLVSGSYELELPTKGKTTVAVKITDMLGEEVLVTEEV